MKYIFYIDATLAAFGGLMTLAVGFVALAFALYIDASPKIRTSLPGVLEITACFALLFVVAGCATLGLRRARNWHWPLQFVLLAILPVLWLIVVSQLRSA